jgi:hypothetical protein
MGVERLASKMIVPFTDEIQRGSIENTKALLIEFVILVIGVGFLFLSCNDEGSEVINGNA